MKLHRSVIDSSEGLDDLRDEWQRLLLAVPTATPFHSWAWCRAFWRHLAPPGCQLQIFIVRDNSGELRGVAPMFIRPGSILRPSLLRSLATEVGDYGGFLVSPTESDPVSGELWRCIDEHSPRWQSAEISKLSLETPKCPSLTLRWRRAESEPCYSFELPNDPDAYMRQLGRKARENLRRRRRRLEREHDAEFRSVRTVDELARILSQFIQLQKERFATKYYRGFFKDRQRGEFFGEVAAAFLEYGWLDLHILEIDGELAAAQFGIELHGCRFNYQIAMDAKYARHSPGMLLMLSSINGAIARGAHRYDLLTGGGEYKRTLQARPQMRYDLTWTRKPLVTFLRRRASLARNRLESVTWLRRLVFTGLQWRRSD